MRRLLFVLSFCLLPALHSIVSAQCTMWVQPQDVQVPPDFGLATLKAVASGTGNSYQWQENGGTGWVNIVDGVNNYYTTNDILHVYCGTVINKNRNGYMYRCVITGSCGTIISDTSMLTYLPSPIIVQPQDVVACENDTVSIKIQASNYNPGSLFWYSINSSGAYTASDTSLVINGVTQQMNGSKYYFLIFHSGSNTSGYWRSDTATLTVKKPATIVAQPKDTTFYGEVGSSVTMFKVVATGTNVKYQWQEDDGTGWVNIPAMGLYVNNKKHYSSGTDSVLVMSFYKIDGYRFRCIVSNDCGVDTSDMATLNLVPPPITVQPTSQAACVGDSVVISLTDTAGPYTYQWFQINTQGQLYSIAHVAPYSNISTGALHINGVTATMNGYKYVCLVWKSWGGWYSDTAELTVNSAPLIVQQPRDSMYLCPVTDATITVATADTPVTYQWQDSTSNGWVNISNTPGVYYGANTNTLHAMGLNLGYGAKRHFRCMVSNSCGTTVSDVATMSSALMPTIISGPAAASVCSGDTATFSITATNALAYQWGMKKGNGLGITLTNNSIFSGVNGPVLTITNTTDSLDGYEFYCHVNDCWWGGSAILTVNNAPAIITHPVDDTSYCELVRTMKFAITVADTAVQYQWQINMGVGWFNIPSVHNIYQGVLTPELVISNLLVSSGVIYRFRCVVTNSCGSDTSDTAKIYVTPPPTIQHTTAYFHELCPGDTANFSIVMNGIVKSYRWEVYKNGAWPPIPLTDTFPNSGVYTPNLKISGITPAMDGDVYYCNVNECMGVPGGIIDVQQAPSFTLQPKSDTICIYDTITTFSVHATGSGQINYQWMGISPGGVHNILTDTPIYFGSQTPALQVTNINTLPSGMKYYCIITGPCGSDTSVAALLSIDSCSLPNVTGSPVNNISYPVVTLYPNPVTGDVLKANIEGLESGTAQVRIVNRLGVVQYDQAHSIEEGIPLILDIQRLPAGVYSLQLVDVNNRKYRATRFVKL